MERIFSFLMASAAVAAIGAFGPAMAGEQDAIDGCIDQLRTVGGPEQRPNACRSTRARGVPN